MTHTILVLEDEISLQRIIERSLIMHGFRVLVGRSIEDGIKALKVNKAVDAVWLDHYLIGQESGVDFVERIKVDERLKRLPIFVVSNTASPDKKRRYLELGVVKYYTKADHPLDKIINDIKQFLRDNHE